MSGAGRRSASVRRLSGVSIRLYVSVREGLSVSTYSRPVTIQLLRWASSSIAQGLEAAGGVVILVEVLQDDDRAIVQGHLADFAFLHLLFEDDLVARGDVGDIVQRLFMILAPGVGVEGVALVVEGDARADDIQHGDAVVGKGRLEQFLDLLWVAGKGARHKGGVGGQRFHADVDRHIGVGALVLQVQAHFGGGGELALGEAVHAVVLDDVEHVHVAAHDVLELAHADAGGVAVAGNADALAGDDRRTGRPVATDGMRPCRPLKPKERFRK